MKSIFAITIAVILAYAAFGVCEERLQDERLAGIYAGGSDFGITDELSASTSSAADQKNISGVSSVSGNLLNANMRNTNTAKVNGNNGSSVALQTNIGSIVNLGSGETRGNLIRNTNDVKVKNVASLNGAADAAQDAESSTSAQSDISSMSVSVAQSAASVQNNIATLIGGGETRSNNLRNSNNSQVTNTGDSAAALQDNIAVIAGIGQGDARSNTVTNRNRAIVTNTASVEGSVEADLNSDIFSAQFLNGESVELTSSQSGVVTQSNIAAVAAPGVARFNNVNNDNRANLKNKGDSAVSLQNNIAVVAGLGEGENRSNRLTNSNDATVKNTISSEGAVEETASGFSSSGAGSHSAFSSISSSQSAIASQNNIGAVMTADRINASRINNSNNARVTQTQ